MAGSYPTTYSKPEVNKSDYPTKINTFIDAVDSDFDSVNADMVAIEGRATTLETNNTGNNTGDMTDADVKTAYENNTDTNAYDDAAVSKLAAIEAGATADQTKTDIDALGVDAATLDTLDRTSFLRSDESATKTSGNLIFNDNILARFGTGNDLDISHDGANSHISNATGLLNINATNGVSGTAIKNEDDMASDSAVHISTQQSIKAFVHGTLVENDLSGLSTLNVSVPTWANEIELFFTEVILSSTANFGVQVGDSGGIHTTTYFNTNHVLRDAAVYSDSSSTNSAAFLYFAPQGTTRNIGKMTLTSINAAGSKIFCDGKLFNSSGSQTTTTIQTGHITLDTIMTQIELYLSTGTFTSGTVQVRFKP